MLIKDIPRFIISTLMCQLAGFIGSFFTIKSVSTWYLTLNKPLFSPPSWIFSPVWIILYLLMSISFYLVWTSKSKNKKIALNFFLIQLSFNTLWPILFFGLKSISLAFIDIVLLWIFILITISSFYKISKMSAYLLAPYILWVSFAMILNFSIFMINWNKKV